MYPKKTNEYQSSYKEIFLDVSDFIVFSIKSFKSPKTLLSFLHKSFHF